MITIAKHTNLSSLFTATADAIRAKKGTTDPIIADNFPDEIAAIPNVEPAETETWEFTLEDDSVVTKEVQLVAGDGSGVKTVTFTTTSSNVIYQDYNPHYFGIELPGITDSINGFMFVNQHVSYTKGENPTYSEIYGCYTSQYYYANVIKDVVFSGPGAVNGIIDIMYPYIIFDRDDVCSYFLFYINDGRLILTTRSDDGGNYSSTNSIYAKLVAGKTYTLYYW